ncbi:MAG: OmpA family protein [Gammaproteobacteria bacterium]|nr:OmpA family protein [Gammaproteobacteria bacterium]MBU0892344.1 OmpA family protein [Gammaproteobacteria bacterium]MBU1816824.1 OmpA family protein [Gammaproteobacteria bacterium]
MTKHRAFPGWVVAAAVLLAVLTGPARAQTRVPTQDIKGLTDPAGFKRYTGAVLLYRDDAAYDEVRFPAAKVAGQNDKLVAPRNLDRAGQRMALQYVAPAGRSSLEVLRGYQQELKAAGFETAYECAGDACGGSNIFTYSLPRSLLPAGWAGKVGDNSPAACAAGGTASDLRYALLDNKASGATLAVLTWNPDITSVYCDEKEFQKRATIAVVRVEPKAREQQMETLSSSEIAKGLDANGKVAIYGILFDTGKADIKAESKASLDQIGGLLKQQTGLKLHVVGHTDNVGNLPANLDLSRRRADAVAAALAKDYGIARDRLTANGVASLAPVASNGSDAGRAKNRRVELVLQ